MILEVLDVLVPTDEGKQLEIPDAVLVGDEMILEVLDVLVPTDEGKQLEIPDAVAVEVVVQGGRLTELL
jgi:hypothetical protein